MEVERSGTWMPADELRQAALVALANGNDIDLNLDKIEDLDASALQVLLSLDREQKRRGQRLRLINASARLLQWFEYAGVADCFGLCDGTNTA